jgi:hypothetical protein
VPRAATRRKPPKNTTAFKSPRAIGADTLVGFKARHCFSGKRSRRTLERSALASPLIREGAFVAPKSDDCAGRSANRGGSGGRNGGLCSGLMPESRAAPALRARWRQGCAARRYARRSAA